MCKSGVIDNQLCIDIQGIKDVFYVQTTYSFKRMVKYKETYLWFKMNRKQNNLVLFIWE